MRSQIRKVIGLGSAAVLVAAASATASPVLAASREAPGAPGAASDWVTGDKDGFGTARGTTSKVWYTLNNGELSEIYYPRIDTPSTRDTQLVVTDGRTFTDRETTDTIHQVRLLDPQSLSYQQVDRAKSGKYLIIKTYTTDPARSTVLVDIEFRSLTGHPYQVYVLHDPALTMTGDDDTGSTQHDALVASDGTTSDAVVASTGFGKTSSGYQGVSDGWTDLASDHHMDWTYFAEQPGNVVQTGQTDLTGLSGRQHLTLAIGFATTITAAVSTARASLAAGFATDAAAYAAGWHSYLATLKPVPQSATQWATEYHVSQMVLAASEDKTYRGGFVASPGRPWAWANVLQSLAVYHAVWSRDLYEIATALIAMGDSAAANRALDYLFNVSKGRTARTHRTAGCPVCRCSAGCRWTRCRSPPCSPVNSAGPGQRTGNTSRRRKTSSSPTARAPPASAGRMRPATRRPRSPRRSPGSWSAPTSPARTATLRVRTCICSSPTPGAPTSTTGPSRQRSVQQRALLPAHHSRRQRRRRDQDSAVRRRTADRSTRGRGPELPRARSPRGAAAR